ncbi:Fc.00g012560.m01.CDS01 [Cosmosporella sp. VM-42]
MEGQHLAKAGTSRTSPRSFWSLESELEAAEHMLGGDGFYTAVSQEEKKVAFEAMAREFQGTGH